MAGSQRHVIVGSVRSCFDKLQSRQLYHVPSMDLMVCCEDESTQHVGSVGRDLLGSRCHFCSVGIQSRLRHLGASWRRHADPSFAWPPELSASYRRGGRTRWLLRDLQDARPVSILQIHRFSSFLRKKCESSCPAYNLKLFER